MEFLDQFSRLITSATSHFPGKKFLPLMITSKSKNEMHPREKLLLSPNRN